MKKIVMNSLLGLVLVLGLTSSASAAVILDRGLPSANLNNAAGANRSNISWISGFPFSGAYWLVGDDFLFATNATVDSLTFYSIANNTVGAGNSAPTSEFTNLTLYYGAAGTLNLSTSTYTSQLVTYPGDGSYQDAAGNFYPIYAITFSGLNFAALANTLYGFALDATGAGANTLALAASNAALSGTPQQGADGFFRYYNAANKGAASFAFAGLCDTSDQVNCGGWDKKSDINVTIQGTLATTAVPEPASLGLMAFGIGALALIARKRKLA